MTSKFPFEWVMDTGASIHTYMWLGSLVAARDPVFVMLALCLIGAIILTRIIHDVNWSRKLVLICKENPIGCEQLQLLD